MVRGRDAAMKTVMEGGTGVMDLEEQFTLMFKMKEFNQVEHRPYVKLGGLDVVWAEIVGFRVNCKTLSKSFQI